MPSSQPSGSEPPLVPNESDPETPPPVSRNEFELPFLAPNESYLGMPPIDADGKRVGSRIVGDCDSGGVGFETVGELVGEPVGSDMGDGADGDRIAFKVVRKQVDKPFESDVVGNPVKSDVVSDTDGDTFGSEVVSDMFGFDVVSDSHSDMVGLGVVRDTVGDAVRSGVVGDDAGSGVVGDCESATIRSERVTFATLVLSSGSGASNSVVASVATSAN